jgi:hypothetical protein
MVMETNYNLHVEGETAVSATAEVRMMGEGDLLISLRKPGVHPDEEQAIVTIGPLVDGSILITVMDSDGGVIETVEVP